MCAHWFMFHRDTTMIDHACLIQPKLWRCRLAWLPFETREATLCFTVNSLLSTLLFGVTYVLLLMTNEACCGRMPERMRALSFDLKTKKDALTDSIDGSDLISTVKNSLGSFLSFVKVILPLSQTFF